MCKIAKIALYRFENGISDIKVINEITEDTISKTRIHINNIDNLTSFISVIKNFDDIFSEFNDTVKKFERNIISLDIFHKIVQSQVSNILFQGYKYTENIKTFLSRHSSEKDKDHFVSKLNDMYDNNFAYRLLYNLRNYDQHCGMPFHEIKKDRTSCKLILNRNKFLSEHKQMQASFRKEILKCSQDNFNILINLYEYAILLGDLHDEICKYYFHLSPTKYIESFTFVTQNYKPPMQNSTYVLLEDYDIRKDNAELKLNMRNIDYISSLKLLEIYDTKLK